MKKSLLFLTLLSLGMGNSADAMKKPITHKCQLSWSLQGGVRFLVRCHEDYFEAIHKTYGGTKHYCGPTLETKMKELGAEAIAMAQLFIEKNKLKDKAPSGKLRPMNLEFSVNGKEIPCGHQTFIIYGDKTGLYDGPDDLKEEFIDSSLRFFQKFEELQKYQIAWRHQQQKKQEKKETNNKYQPNRTNNNTRSPQVKMLRATPNNDNHVKSTPESLFELGQPAFGDH